MPLREPADGRDLNRRTDDRRPWGPSSGRAANGAGGLTVGRPRRLGGEAFSAVRLAAIASLPPMRQSALARASERSRRQHDLARNVLSRLGHEGLAGFGERVDRANLGPQRALVNEARDVTQFGAAGGAHEVNYAD